MKPIDLVVYSCRGDIFDVIRPVNSYELIPDWWKELPSVGDIDPNTLVRDTNMKGCKGFIDLYKSSVTIPLWTDINIEVGAKGDDSFRWAVSDCKTEVTWHPDQHKGNYMSGRDFCNVRIRTPWRFYAKEPLNLLYTNAGWSRANPFDFYVPNGVVDTSVTKVTNVMFVVERAPSPQLLELKAGEAMAQYIPLTERTVKLHYELVSESKFASLETPMVSFTHNYNKIDKLKNMFMRG